VRVPVNGTRGERGEKDIVSTVRPTRWITLLPISRHCPFNSDRRIEVRFDEMESGKRVPVNGTRGERGEEDIVSTASLQDGLHFFPSLLACFQGNRLKSP
jgi:hypothetical protein